MDRYRDYDPFAWLYANHWGADYHKQAYDVLERLFLRRLKRGAAILDLCCGDGRLTAALHRRGYQMVGLDGSERLLEIARERHPGIQFIAADARDFELSGRFDAVISTFDALNHIMSPDEFGAVCVQVAKVLQPGGYFAFDLNREAAFTDLWAQSSAQVEHDVVHVSLGAYDPASRVARCDITLFRRMDGEWRRSDFTLSEYAHREQDVMSSLLAAGFEDMQVYDAQADLGMCGNIGWERDFYLARRASAGG